MTDLYPSLSALADKNIKPTIEAYNRIDGPGSSLDLREFQEALWSLPSDPEPGDSTGKWTRNLPRTIAMTVDVGCRISAQPLEKGQIGIVSKDYDYQEILPAGSVPFEKQFWLLKILDIFNLSGVNFILHNVIPGIKSSGLGGSATAATAFCLLANKLAGSPFNNSQIVAMASLIEQDMGVSITGTQEQANVVYGGVCDYVWFPWGIPGQKGMYGSSMRFQLMDDSLFDELSSCMRIYHSGQERASTDVNKVWRERLEDPEGFKLHKSQLDTAFAFREGIRLQDWSAACLAIKHYREVRQTLCEGYMSQSCKDIQQYCEKYGAESFPLGAGGGGAVLLFASNPDQLLKLDRDLESHFRKIDFKLKSNGHEFTGFDDHIQIF